MRSSRSTSLPWRARRVLERKQRPINFSRFDAKLEQRFAQQDTKWEQRFAQLETRWEQRFAQMDGKWEQRLGALSAEIHSMRADLIKWMFLFWAGTALAGLLLR